MNKNQERIRRLKKDFKEMNKLASKVRRIRFTTEGNSDAPESYKVDMEIRSIKETKPNKPRIYEKNFKLEIRLPKNYPDSPPECKVNPAPFHPHFNKHGRWIDYKEYSQDEGLRTLVLRIARSLQYDPNFIEINPTTKIGNESALAYYKSNFNKNKKRSYCDFFPVDKRPLSAPSKSAQPKKFRINSKRDVVSRTEHPRKKFEIVDSTPAYQPKEKSIPEFETFRRSTFRGRKPPYRLYIQPKAREKIFEHIGWGKTTRKNRVEQGGILLGHVFKDPGGITYGVVEDVVVAESAMSTDVYLEMDHNAWERMINYVDNVLNSHLETNLQIIGWYHTHPNNLNVFMSAIDLNTQNQIFSHDWQFAVVLNPHQKIWSVFHGKNSKKCQGFMITDNRDQSLDNVGEELHQDNKKRNREDDSHKNKNNPMYSIRILGTLLLKLSKSLFHKTQDIAEENDSEKQNLNNSDYSVKIDETA